MATLKVFDANGKEVGTCEVDLDAIAPTINRQLLHDAVVMYQANQRVGTHRTKSRGEVSGTTRKMYRQKGTGNARAGSKRSGIRRGGGHIFAKRPRDYSYRLPRKAVRMATRMALVSKIQDDQMVVVDKLTFDAPATKQMAGVLSALGLSDGSTLVATAECDLNVYRSARNIRGVEVSPVADLNALSVLRPDKVLVTRDALDQIVQRATAKIETTTAS